MSKNEATVKIEKVFVIIGFIVDALIFSIAIYLPPPGDVTANVLKGMALIAVLPLSLLAASVIESSMHIKFTHDNTSVEINKDKE